MTKYTDILKDLKEQVQAIKDLDQDMEEASWNYEEGVIISGDEAEMIICELEGISKTEPKQKSSTDVCANCVHLEGFHNHKEKKCHAWPCDCKEFKESEGKK